MFSIQILYSFLITDVKMSRLVRLNMAIIVMFFTLQNPKNT